MTKIVDMRLDHITKDDVEGLSLSGSALNANWALRTLRRMLHKAEEWNLITRVPKFKLLTEHGMSDRVCEVLRTRAGGRSEGWLFPSKRSKCGHLTDVGRQFREARAKAGLPEDRSCIAAVMITVHGY